MNAMLRRSMATLVGLVALMVAPAAFAEGEPCYNDDDCPNPACGGDVCNWGKSSPTPDPDGIKVFYCQPAGKEPKGRDGWCTDTSDCKCKGEGATCVAPYCTATQSSGGGGTGAGGTGAGGTGTAGTGTAGTGTAGTGTAGTASKPAEESSGCSTSAPITSGGGIALALGMLGLGAAYARRRRS